MFHNLLVLLPFVLFLFDLICYHLNFELSSYSAAYYFGIGTYLCSIKNDDKMIQAEGVESLSEEELRQACRERGHLGLLSTEEMRQQVCPLNLMTCNNFRLPKARKKGLNSLTILVVREIRKHLNACVSEGY